MDQVESRFQDKRSGQVAYGIGSLEDKLNWFVLGWVSWGKVLLGFAGFIFRH